MDDHGVTASREGSRSFKAYLDDQSRSPEAVKTTSWLSLMDKKLVFKLINNCVFHHHPLSTAGGMLHFHPDNMCSEDRDKVSSQHWLLPYTAFLMIFYHSNNFVFFPLCRADGRQPQPKTSAPCPAVHAGSELRPSLHSLVPHPSLGASPQPQTTPPLHAGAMPHATSQQKKVEAVKQRLSVTTLSQLAFLLCVNSLIVLLLKGQQHNNKIVEVVLPSYTKRKCSELALLKSSP